MAVENICSLSLKQITVLRLGKAKMVLEIPVDRRSHKERLDGVRSFSSEINCEKARFNSQ